MSSTSFSVKRIMREARDLAKESEDPVHAGPLQDELFDWHFSIGGPRDSEFAGGVYHGVLRLPMEYPFKPPDIYLLTKNGRFQVMTRICLSFSTFHAESWNPSWNIKSMLMALGTFMESPADGGIGSLNCSKEERQKYAVESRSFVCDKCGAKHSEIAKSFDERLQLVAEGSAPPVEVGPPSPFKFTVAPAASEGADTGSARSCPEASATGNGAGELQGVPSSSSSSSSSPESSKEEGKRLAGDEPKVGEPTLEHADSQDWNAERGSTEDSNHTNPPKTRSRSLEFILSYGALIVGAIALLVYVAKTASSGSSGKRGV